MIRKFTAISIICLLMLMLIPSVLGVKDYPKENGPYKVSLVGKCNSQSGFPFPIWFCWMGWQIGPFCKYNYPAGVGYFMLNNSKLIVNGVVQGPNDWQPPVMVIFNGFRGYAPTGLILRLKWAVPSSDLRVFGVCDSISFLK